ncbi:MAG: c-type cytochrome, partial [SAR324 cluster bacterium]|nr:c-type cytochrome [SAR324 cluster bacterium]
MKNKLVLIFAVALIFGATSLVLYQQKKQEAHPQTGKAAQIRFGAQVFSQNCASCHGKGAVGENSQFIKGGAKIGGGYWAPALNGTAHAWHHPPEMLWEIVKFGSMAQDSPMRGFKGKLSDQEMNAA